MQAKAKLAREKKVNIKDMHKVKDQASSGQNRSRDWWLKLDVLITWAKNMAKLAKTEITYYFFKKNSTDVLGTLIKVLRGPCLISSR